MVQSSSALIIFKVLSLITYLIKCGDSMVLLVPLNTLHSCLLGIEIKKFSLLN